MHLERFGRSFPLHAISKPRAHQNTTKNVEVRRWLIQCTGNQHKIGGPPGDWDAFGCPVSPGGGGSHNMGDRGLVGLVG